MYNRYIQGGFDGYFGPPPPPPPPFAPVDGFHGPPPHGPPHHHHPHHEPPPPPPGGLLGALGGIKLPELDGETIMLLALVYFLISEEGENVSDTLLIIGVLLMLGF
jgi:hypothetical protein